MQLAQHFCIMIQAVKECLKVLKGTTIQQDLNDLKVLKGTAIQQDLNDVFSLPE